MAESTEQDDLYGWARRHGLHWPYDFALLHEGRDVWGRPDVLTSRARRWEEDCLHRRKKEIEEEVAALLQRIAVVEQALERNRTREF